MTTDVITTTSGTPIEDAAHLMAAEKIGGLPVVDEDNRVVGVITETDILEVFDELFTGDYLGLRLSLEVREKKGILAALCRAIFELSGSIVSIGSFHGNGSGERGVFALHRPRRPNSIDATAVDSEVVGKKDVLRVRGLDALNGTPVLDLKPA